jgi:hypothetical protein
MLKKTIFFIGLILLFSSFSKADVPPSAGEIRVKPPLIISTTEDFSEYRFFFLSPSQVEEIQLKAGETKSLSSENRGGANKFGSLYAIKISLLDKNNFKVTENRDATRNLFQEIIESNKNEVIELLKHSFQKDISARERLNWTYPSYQIERSGDMIKAVVKHEIAEKISDDELKIIDGGKYKFATIIAGVFIALAVIGVGLFLFRKSVDKP